MKAGTNQEMFEFSQLGKWCVLVFQLEPVTPFGCADFVRFQVVKMPKMLWLMCVCVLKAKLGDERFQLSS